METPVLLALKRLNLPSTDHPEYKSVLNLALREVLTSLINEQANLSQRLTILEKKVK